MRPLEDPERVIAELNRALAEEGDPARVRYITSGPSWYEDDKWHIFAFWELPEPEGSLWPMGLLRRYRRRIGSLFNEEDVMVESYFRTKKKLESGHTKSRRVPENRHDRRASAPQDVDRYDWLNKDMESSNRVSTPIRLSGVTKNYGKARGVIDLNLEVQPGEVFGYLGPNGAGKTTTIRMLVDLIRPQYGTVEVLGGAPSDPAIRRRIGYLPGEVEFYQRMTGGDFLTYIGHLRGEGGSALARELSERIDLDLSRRISDLSKGNRQKLGLVQALMHQPELVVLDEPTSGLDPLVQQEVYRLIDEIRAEGVTIFFSSHVLSEVERVADRVGIIREGRLVEVEQLEALRQKAVRTFEVVFEDTPAVAEFEKLEGVRSAGVHGNTLHCQVIGSIDELVKAVAGHTVRNLVSHGADLEALFLDYYRGEEDAK